jgi:ribosomal protein S12 methylthiotransferase
VPEPLKEERRARLMAAQTKISAARLRTKVGRDLDVLVDSVGADHSIARSTADAPEIDGIVRIVGAPHVATGQFTRVRVVSSDAHDLQARSVA